MTNDSSSFGPDAGVIRDSLYSRVPVSAHALGLMATPQFLRLQRIKQLGWVFTVWPGATHTRYEHALGVYHLARRALEGLLAAGPDGGLADAEPRELRTVLAAALLHDIGHYPYSHGIEELGTPIEPHERAGARIIRDGDVAAALAAWGVATEDVARLVLPAEHAGAEPDRWGVYRALLSGALDVDKLDYLPRDARGCNVPYGGVDAERLLDALRVVRHDGALRLAITEKGISPLHSLVRARQEMFDNVYWHHTNRACMAMLLRAVQDALDAGALAATELREQDDATLPALLTSRRMPPTTRALVGSLALRRIHKRTVEFARVSGPVFARLDGLFHDPVARKRLELRLGRAVAARTGLHVAEHELLLDIPKPERWETDALVLFEHPPVGMPELTTWREATGLRGEDLAAYEAHRRRIRLVTTARLRDRVRALRDEVVLPEIARGTGLTAEDTESGEH